MWSERRCDPSTDVPAHYMAWSMNKQFGRRWSWRRWLWRRWYGRRRSLRSKRMMIGHRSHYHNNTIKTDNNGHQFLVLVSEDDDNDDDDMVSDDDSDRCRFSDSFVHCHHCYRSSRHRSSIPSGSLYNIITLRTADSLNCRRPIHIVHAPICPVLFFIVYYTV